MNRAWRLDGARALITGGSSGIGLAVAHVLGPRDPETLRDYRLLDRLGEGGMGTVYRAVQDQPQRVVALKMMRFGIADADRDRPG